MNILVFGKDGQLGKAFQNVFEAQKLDALHNIQYLSRVQCDLRNTEALSKLLQDVQPQLIINAAAYTAVDEAEKEIDLAYAINADAPAIMGHYAVQNGATLVHYSTDYVFDGAKAAPYLETDVLNPLGIYGKSKMAGEVVIKNTFRGNRKPQAQFGILRTSWVYGDGGNFIRTILHLAKERESLKVIDNQYGVPTSALWLAGVSFALVLDENHQLRSFPSGVYHAIPQGETTWHKLACFAVQAALDAGATLKLRPSQIEAIPASEYPLSAPRPMNSRMARSALDALLNQIYKNGDVTKLQQWQQSWQESVVDYVQDLVFHKYI